MQLPKHPEVPLWLVVVQGLGKDQLRRLLTASSTWAKYAL